MPELVCPNCWSWHSSGTVCPRCRVPLTNPGAPAGGGPQQPSSYQPPPGYSTPGFPAPPPGFAPQWQGPPSAPPRSAGTPMAAIVAVVVAVAVIGGGLFLLGRSGASPTGSTTGTPPATPAAAPVMHTLRAAPARIAGQARRTDPSLVGQASSETAAIKVMPAVSSALEAYYGGSAGRIPGYWVLALALKVPVTPGFAQGFLSSFANRSSGGFVITVDLNDETHTTLNGVVYNCARENVTGSGVTLSGNLCSWSDGNVLGLVGARTRSSTSTWS